MSNNGRCVAKFINLFKYLDLKIKDSYKRNVCWQVESHVSIIPQDILLPAFPEAPENVSAFWWITIALFNMLAVFPSFKLITESEREIVVIPVLVVDTILPRSPTCLVVEVGAP